MCTTYFSLNKIKRKKTRGRWTTSLTWETFLAIKKVEKVMFIQAGLFRVFIFYFHFVICLPKMSWHLLNKLDSPSHKDALCQVLLILVHLLRRRIFFLNLSTYFRYYFPMAYLSISFTQEFLVPGLVEIGSVVRRRRFKFEKFTDRQKTGDQKSPAELKIQVDINGK